MAHHEGRWQRRAFLTRGFQAAAVLLLSGCDKFFDGLQRNEKFVSLLETAEGANRRVQRLFTGRNKLAREFSESDISRFFKPNGNPPPITIDYAMDAKRDWSAWRLEVSGLVESPARYSLAELKSMPGRTQITRHDCVEGWSAIAKWRGVPLREIVQRVRPKPDARYIIFHCMDTDDNGQNYYESVDMEDALHPQTILAFEMNDRPLPIEHGAPLRLRLENQLGYKMAKYIRALEFVRDFKSIQAGRGGYWEDQGYEWYAGI